MNVLPKQKIILVEQVVLNVYNEPITALQLAFKATHPVCLSKNVIFLPLTDTDPIMNTTKLENKSFANNPKDMKFVP